MCWNVMLLGSNGHPYDLRPLKYDEWHGVMITCVCSAEVLRLCGWRLCLRKLWYEIVFLLAASHMVEGWNELAQKNNGMKGTNFIQCSKLCMSYSKSFLSLVLLRTHKRMEIIWLASVDLQFNKAEIGCNMLEFLFNHWVLQKMINRIQSFDVMSKINMCCVAEIFIEVSMLAS